MRLVDLRLVEDQHSRLGLHPNLSVVTGLSPAARAWLADALAALLGGADSGLLVRVDVDGVEADLRPGAGDPVLRRPVDLLVRATDLPEHDDEGTANDPARRAASEELQRARAAHAAAVASLKALEGPAREAALAHRTVAESHELARRAIAQAREDLDPYASATLEAALATAMRLEIELGASPGACRADTIDSVKERIVVLEAQRRDIGAALDMLASVDPEPVTDALDLVRVVTATGPIAPPEVLRLADEWASISEHLAALEAKFAAEEGGVQSVSDRLEIARARLAAAESALTPAPVRAEDVQALEAAHERVLAAERKASSRLGGNRALRALEEALAEQQIYLDRLGYPTWSAWIMGAPLLDATAEHAKRLEQARREVDEATWAWERLTEKLETDPEFRALLDRLERVLEAAHAIVGDVDDVEQALRSLRIDPGPPPCSVAEARERLAAALVGAGFEVEDDTSLDDLRLHAERWLAEIRTVAALRRQLEIDFDQCGAELTRAQETFDRLEAVGPADPGDGFGSTRLEDTRAVLLAAEDRVNRHRRALTRVAHLVAEAEGVAELERQLAVAAEAKAELLEMTRRIADAAEARCRSLEAALGDDVDAGGWEAPTDEDETVIDYLDSRISAARLAAGGGSVPIVFDDTLAALPTESQETVLGWLEMIAADTQILYVTDDPAVLAWASRRQPAKVGVVSGSGFFGRVVSPS
jgi:hypothetical protein